MCTDVRTGLYTIHEKMHTDCNKDCVVLVSESIAVHMTLQNAFWILCKRTKRSPTSMSSQTVPVEEYRDGNIVFEAYLLT